MVSASHQHGLLPSSRVRTEAQGRWRDILAGLNIQVPATAKQHGPCPACGGKDRFRFDDQEGRGTWFCNQCDPKAGDGFDLVRNVRGCDFPTSVSLVGGFLGMERSQPAERRISDTYDYVNEPGDLIFQVVRFQPKDFRQRRPDGHGGWIWDLKGIEPVLYKLPDIIRASHVLVVEGEKDVETASRLRLPEGWVATCNPMGAGKWRDSYTEALLGKHVVLWPDADEPGEAHANLLTTALNGTVASLRRVQVTDVKDLSEWAAADGSVETFHALLSTAQPWPTPTAAKAHTDESDEHTADELGTFPADAWRGPFKLYREAMSGTSEAPDTSHFTAFWGIAAACLRRRVSFYYAYPHFPNVYLVNFGNTGDSKTSAARQGLRLLPDNGIKLLRGVGSAEALGDWMQQPDDGPHVSHLLFIEELATLLTRGGWEGSTLLTFLTETFDAPDKYEIPFRKNPVLVDEPTPTLIAGTTIEWLWKGLREIDVHGGFGNRIFYMTGTPKPPIPLPAKPDATALTELRAHLGRLATFPSTEFFLTPEAQEIWNSFYLAWKTTTWPELTTAAIKRIPAYILKLSMVYACLERTSLITAEQLTASIQVGHYGAKCADRLMNRHRLHTAQGKCEARVMAVLLHEDHPAWKIHRRISGSFTAEELARALRALETAGAIFPVGHTARHEPVYGRRDRKRGV